MFEVLMFYCLDELVADMVVDPDAAHAKSEHTQRVLVIVGQRAMADCAKERRNKRNQIILKHDFTVMFKKWKSTLFSPYVSLDGIKSIAVLMTNSIKTEIKIGAAESFKK